MDDTGTRIALSWLGHPSAESKGHRVSFPAKKSVALLACISLSERPLSREYLATLLWAEYDQVRAFANLRQALHRLNAAFHEVIIETRRDAVELLGACNISIDVREFLDSLEDVKNHEHESTAKCRSCLGELERAVALYRAPFMEGFNLSDSPAFDEWQDLWRSRLQRKYAWALETLSAGLAEVGRWDDAIEAASRWLALDSLDEKANQTLMRLHALAGQTAAAARRFEDYRRNLEREIGQRPSPETRRLRDAIASGDPSFAGRGDAGSIGKELVECAPDRKEAGIFQAPPLKTKLFMPKEPKSAVRRERLSDTIARGLERGLVIVSGPAGFGKSTAVADWARSARMPVAWLSLDTEDNDPRRLLLYVVSAIRAIAPGVGVEAREFLKAPGFASEISVAASLLHDLEALSTPIALVLDDFERVGAGPSLEIVSFFLDHLPESLRLLIVTRAEPALPLGRFRCAGALTEIRTDDLRFERLEAEEFFHARMGLSLDEPDLAILEERTEGWIAGMQLAAISLRGRDDARSFMDTLKSSTRFILDYLMEEVFERQSCATKEFLLRCSVLDRLSGALCDAVRGEEGSAAMLHALEKANLFLVPLDDEGDWYRFHYLFSMLLRHLARRERSESFRTASHRRAGAWLLEAGMPEEAIGHFLAVGDFQSLVAAIRLNLGSLMARGYGSAILGWIGSLPRSAIEGNPELSFFKAAVSVYSLPSLELREGLESMERALPSISDGERRRFVEMAVAVIGGFLDFSGGALEGAVEKMKKALGLLAASDSWIIGNIYWVLLTSYGGLEEWEEARSVFEASARKARAERDAWSFSAIASQYSGILMMRGDLGEADSLFREMFAMEEEAGAESACSFCRIHSGYSTLLLERNEVEKALASAKEGLRRAEIWHSPTDIAYSRAALGAALIARGDYDAAAATMELAEGIMGSGVGIPGVICFIARVKARLISARGTREEAASWAKTLSAMEAGSADERDQLAISAARLRMMLHCGDGAAMEGMAAELSILAQGCERKGRLGRLIEVRVLQALCAMRVHDADAALHFLEGALRIGAPQAYVRVFLNEGGTMAELLSEGLRKAAWDDPASMAFAATLLRRANA